MTASRVATLTAVGLAALLMISVRACFGGHKQAPAQAAAVAAEEQKTIGQYVGVLTARRTAVVSVEFEGRVVELLAQRGDRVAAGDPIARLDDASIRRALADARTAADAAAARRRDPAIDLEDARQRLGLASWHDDAESSPGGASGGAWGGAAQHGPNGEVAALQRRLDAAVVRAPMAGVVIALPVRLGQALAPGAPVAHILDPSELRVRFAVPLDGTTHVRAGSRVILEVDGSGVVVPGTVRDVAMDVQPPLRLLVVEAELAAPEGGEALLQNLPIESSSVGRVRLLDAPPDRG